MFSTFSTNTSYNIIKVSTEWYKCMWFKSHHLSCYLRPITACWGSLALKRLFSNHIKVVVFNITAPGKDETRCDSPTNHMRWSHCRSFCQQIRVYDRGPVSVHRLTSFKICMRASGCMFCLRAALSLASLCDSGLTGSDSNIILTPFQCRGWLNSADHCTWHRLVTFLHLLSQLSGAISQVHQQTEADEVR